MDNQLKACFKKERLAFFRTNRFTILAAIILGWAIIGPLLLRGLGLMMNSFAPIYEEFGMDVSEMVEVFSEAVSLGVSSAINDITTTGLIAFLILINAYAGGEQKKRSIMIPKTSGLKNFAYLFPKFIIYPLTALILAIIAGFASWAVSSIVFEVNDVSAGNVLMGGILAGVSLMFYICIHLTLGTATGRAGMSSIIVIIISLLVPSMFAALGSDLIYNPFALNIMATSVISFAPPLGAFTGQEIIVTAIIAIVLMKLLFFIALFAQNSKRIDNSGNEIRL